MIKCANTRSDFRREFEWFIKRFNAYPFTWSDSFTSILFYNRVYPVYQFWYFWNKVQSLTLPSSHYMNLLDKIGGLRDFKASNGIFWIINSVVRCCSGFSKRIFHCVMIVKPGVVQSWFSNKHFFLILSDMCPPDLTIVLTFSTLGMSLSVPINIFLVINLL